MKKLNHWLNNLPQNTEQQVQETEAPSILHSNQAILKNIVLIGMHNLNFKICTFNSLPTPPFPAHLC